MALNCAFRMLFDGSDDSQLSGDSKLMPATVNFSAWAIDIARGRRKNFKSIFVMGEDSYFSNQESTVKHLIRGLCTNVNEL